MIEALRILLGGIFREQGDLISPIFFLPSKEGKLTEVSEARCHYTASGCLSYESSSVTLYRGFCIVPAMVLTKSMDSLQ
jgi:hypothetical protein